MFLRPVTSSLVEMLSSNPYFGAGFGLMGVGAGFAFLRRSSKIGVEYMKKKCFVSIEIPHTDKSYNWFLHWMSRNVSQTQNLSLLTTFRRRDNGIIDTKFEFLPSVGNHVFRHKNTWIHVERTRDKQNAAQSPGSTWEYLSIRMLGWNRMFLLDLLNEAKELALQAEEGRTVIFTSFGAEWRPFGFPRKKRPISSVVLSEGLKFKILNDIKEFLNNSNWYSNRGIPYRRGYLLHGPPGSGKSSFIQALAGELNLNICLLSLSERGLTDDRMNHLLTIAPEKSIILLEDVDAAFNKNKKVEDRSMVDHISNVTFSGLLNALDGVAAAEGRILFMTTNHPQRLDPALIRPGRIDMQLALGNADKSQVRSMFKMFYPEATGNQVNTFVDSVPNCELSMAQIQGYFLTHKNNPQQAIAHLDELVGGNAEKL